MNDEAVRLLLDLHRDADRQGPGGEAETARAIALAGLEDRSSLRIADIGCGTGASTITLARRLDAEITAVDLFPEFLDVLAARAEAAGVAGRIHTLCASMDNLPWAEGCFDVVWSEGAVYNMGFERGVSSWRRYLGPGGVLVVSELTWLTANVPAELREHWEREYPEVATAADKFRVLEHAGYSPLGYFVLPRHCWTDNYYAPMRLGFPSFLERNANSEAARAIVEDERREMEFYERYGDRYGYGVYVAQLDNKGIRR